MAKNYIRLRSFSILKMLRPACILELAAGVDAEKYRLSETPHDANMLIPSFFHYRQKFKFSHIMIDDSDSDFATLMKPAFLDVFCGGGHGGVRKNSVLLRVFELFPIFVFRV